MTLLALDRVARASVRPVSFVVAPGERLALVGPGGDTLLDIIAGRIRANAGRIRLGDDDITHAGERDIRRLGVGASVRTSGGFASMTARESVQLAILATRGEAGGWWRPAIRRHRSQAEHLLDRVGLIAHAGRGTERMNLSERRRLDLALTLAHRPRLLLLHDPAADLLPDDGAALLELIRTLTAAADAAVLLATHDPARAAGWADRSLLAGTISDQPAANSPPPGCAAGLNVLN